MDDHYLKRTQRDTYDIMIETYISRLHLCQTGDCEYRHVEALYAIVGRHPQQSQRPFVPRLS